MQQFKNIADAQSLALAIVDAIPDPLVVLDDTCRVIAANRGFAEAFNADPQASHDQSLFELAGGAWDIPPLRTLIAGVFANRVAVDGFEAEGNFAGAGQRTIVLNARLVEFAEHEGPTLLLGIKDITARREIEFEKAQLLDRTAELLDQQKILVREMQHRVANSLQIIASILMLKTRAITSPEAREHLKDAHERVMSVAQVQAHLSSVEGIDQIDVPAYLAKLCKGLAASMIGPDKPIEVLFRSEATGTLDSDRTVSIGLIVTELVLNAIKHAFPSPKRDARILVSYEADASDWTLSVRDNGLGTAAAPSTIVGGLGTAIVDALAKKLGANIATTANDTGRSVVVGPAPVGTKLPIAA